MNNQEDKTKKTDTPPVKSAKQAPVSKQKPKKHSATTAKRETDAKNPPKTQKSGSGNIIAMLALLIALAVAAACYLLWQQLNETQSIAKNASSSANTATSISDDIKNSMAHLQNRLQQLEESLSQANNTGQMLQEFKQQLEELKSRQTTIQSTVDNLQTAANNNNNPSGWNISEALYLVNIANHRLNLEGDIDTAIAALKAADLRLKQTGDPGLIEARRTLANEINALNSINLPDINGIALSLDSLARSAESLIIPDIEPSDSFKPGINVEKQAGSDWKDTANSIWNEIKSLVSVRRGDDSSSPPSLAPDQRFYLRQNLRFKLEAARIALLRKDTAAFRNNLKIARDWIENYFVSDNAAAKNILDSLDEMQSIELKPALPDISASYKILRALNKKQQTAPTKASNGEAA